jgi:acyl-CoA reductase-like NAD-dependent aldehyde dehydrogenase
VGELVKDALGAGAHAPAGGTALPGRGYLFAPAILTNACDGMRVVDEEQFGPVLPLIRYHSLEEAIDRADATHFGLSGSVGG